MLDSSLNITVEEFADLSLAVDWIQFFIQDPQDLDKDGYPRTLYRVHAFLKEYNPVLFKTDKLHLPMSELLDEEITTLFLDDLQGKSIYPQVHQLALAHMELKRPTRVIFSCSRCAGGLNINFCHGCDERFEDDLVREAWQFPLPQKIVDLLIDHGHQFQQDPQVAYREEKKAAEFPIFGLEE